MKQWLNHIRMSKSKENYLENSLFDDSPIVIQFNLEFHDISTGGSTNQTCPYVFFGFVERANVSRILIVIDNIVVIRVCDGNS